MKWSTALPDWERRIVAGESMVPCGPLFPAEAEDAFGRYFGELRIVDAPGMPQLKDARPWVTDFVKAIFGAYDRETGRQLIKEFLLLISKKNGKSTIAAGIMLTALMRNWRNSAEFIILAPTIEIANNSFIPARDMIAHHDELREFLHVQEHVRTITHDRTKATLRVIAADNESVGGKKATGILVDELWLFGKRANAESMLREATGGRASRPEGFTIFLSTHSDEPPAGVWRQALNDYRDIRDGKLDDPRRLGVLYEFPRQMVKDKAYLDPRNWGITNPNLRVSVDEEYLIDEMGKAERAGPSSILGFAAKHLNVEIGEGLFGRWAGADYWQAGIFKTALDLDELIARSETAVVGIDGGGLDDLLGLAVIGRARDGIWLLWTHAWAHPIALQRRKSEAPRILDLANDGDLEIVQTMGDDIEGVCDIIERLSAAGLLPKKDAVGVDPFGIGQIVDALTERGITDDQIVAVSQGWKLSGAIKTAERKLADGTLKHGGQPLMSWCVGNAKVEPKGNAITITKALAGAGKIDPLMASFNAIALMSMNPPSQRSVYEERGLVFL